MIFETNVFLIFLLMEEQYTDKTPETGKAIRPVNHTILGLSGICNAAQWNIDLNKILI